MLLADLLPWFDAGIIVIIFTFVVKTVLFPISKKAVRTQAVMKILEPELNEIKAKYSDKQEQARRTMQFYKDKKINPFSSILLLFIQLPILFALYQIFLSNGLSVPDANILYSFVKAPEAVNTIFLGLKKAMF
jgi:YidC/Oxa1 family membrane protein insertase